MRKKLSEIEEKIKITLRDKEDSSKKLHDF